MSRTSSTPPPQTKALGVTAFVVALVVLVVGTAAASIAGSVFAPVVKAAANSSVDASAPASAGVFIGFFAYFIFGTVLGLWAIIQGIVAIVKKRGRGYGVAAIIIAVLAPITGIFGYILVLGLSVPS